MHVERAFVICLHFFLAVYGVRTGNRCIEDLSKSFTVQLQCHAGEWIHVVQELYGDGDSATCHLKSAELCSKLINSSQQGLVVNCNGKQSCREVMQVRPINNCNITKAFGEVQYNCIKGSMNMCSSVTTTVNGSVYLHSLGFPDSVGVNSSCVIRITGQTLQVTLVEQRMRSGILNISGDGRELWSNAKVDQYNRELPGPAAEIVIVYKNPHHNGSYVWIRVAGQMNITITGEILDTSTTSSSTQQPSRSQSTSGPSTSDTLTTETTTRALYTTIDQSTETLTGDPTTNTTTAVTTPKSTTALTTPKSATRLIVSAVSGCVVTILIVVIAVVLCRKHVKKSRPLETPGKGHFERPSELSSINTEKHHNGFRQNETCNQYFVLDSEFGAGGGQALNTEPGHRTETSLKNEQDRHAKALPLGCTVDMYDKSTITVTNSEADIGAPNVIRDPNGGLADNDHQGICGLTENYFHSKQVWKRNCEMIENDVYDGGPHAANENNVDDSYGVGLETKVGMVDNGLYDKFDFDRKKESVQDESRHFSKQQ